MNKIFLKVLISLLFLTNLQTTRAMTGELTQTCKSISFYDSLDLLEKYNLENGLAYANSVIALMLFGYSIKLIKNNKFFGKLKLSNNELYACVGLSAAAFLTSLSRENLELLSQVDPHNYCVEKLILRIAHLIKFSAYVSMGSSTNAIIHILNILRNEIKFNFTKNIIIFKSNNPPGNKILLLDKCAICHRRNGKNPINLCSDSRHIFCSSKCLNENWIHNEIDRISCPICLEKFNPEVSPTSVIVKTKKDIKKCLLLCPLEIALVALLVFNFYKSLMLVLSE